MVVVVVVVVVVVAGCCSGREAGCCWACWRRLRLRSNCLSAMACWAAAMERSCCCWYWVAAGGTRWAVGEVASLRGPSVKAGPSSGIGGGGVVVVVEGPPGRVFVVGGCGAGREGTRLPPAPGGFGAARVGTREPAGAAAVAAGAARGIGGGARGFSKLPSWFCGKRGLVEGEVTVATGLLVGLNPSGC